MSSHSGQDDVDPVCASIVPAVDDEHVLGHSLCSLCPVVAMLELTGICVTVAFPTLMGGKSAYSGNSIVVVNFWGLSLKVLAFLPGGVG